MDSPQRAASFADIPELDWPLGRQRSLSYDHAIDLVGLDSDADSEVDGVPSTTELTKLQVYVGVWPEGERIPFAGAIPFAIE